jgi:hypothetical protein
MVVFIEDVGTYSKSKSGSKGTRTLEVEGTIGRHLNIQKETTLSCQFEAIINQKIWREL